MALKNTVASGDTTQTSTVLWASSPTLGNVTFEYSINPNFLGNSISQQTAVIADPLVPAKVQVTGLIPNTKYYYRVKDAVGNITTGEFKTAAPLGTRTGLRFGVSGDWQGELSPYPAIANADERNLDFFVQMGDTVEMDSASPALPGVRQSTTLEQFRIKYKEINDGRFGISNWSDLRASTSVYATWDDHELTNDFAGGAPASQKPSVFGTSTERVNDLPIFDAALQAFQESKPVRDEFYGETGDTRTAQEKKLYRYNTFGNDAASFVLDLRSFRDAPLAFLPETATPEQVNKYLQDSFAPNRTMLGAAQLEQFKKDLLKAQQDGITWKFVMSTVPMQNFGIPTAGERWEGFARERTELLRFIKENNIENVVFVTGDFHGHVVNNVTYQEGFGQPQIQTDVMDIMIGPVGIQLTVPFLPTPFNKTFAAPFGPATVGFTPPSLLAAQGKSQAEYLALTDRAKKDQYVREILDDRITKLGYDPIGLEGSTIDAKLLKGSYVAMHTYNWTEFEIDPITQKLLVTTYGVEPYTQAELEANPTIANRQPEIVNQFEVNPKRPVNAVRPKLKNTANDIFVTEGTAGNVNLLFSFNKSNTSFINEFGFFAVDDEQGKIGNLAPGQTNYLQTALSRAEVVFSGLPDAYLAGNNLTRQVSIPSNQRLMFYLVQNGTRDGILAGQSNANVFFSLASANSDRFDHLQVSELNNQGFKLAWEDESGGGDRDFDDFEVTIQPSDAPLSPSTKFQSQIEIIDLTDKPVDQAVAAKLTVNSEAAYNNFAGFYVVQDAQGTVIDPLTGASLTPEQAGYAQAAIRQSVLNFDRNGSSSVNLKGGVLLAPFLIGNSSPEAFLASNPNNQQGGTLAYFAYSGANPDKVDHVRLLGNNKFGFEDLFNGGDNDFNDFIVGVDLA